LELNRKGKLWKVFLTTWKKWHVSFLLQDRYPYEIQPFQSSYAFSGKPLIEHVSWKSRINSSWVKLVLVVSPKRLLSCGFEIWYQGFSNRKDKKIL